MVALGLVGYVVALGVIDLRVWWPGMLDKFDRTCPLQANFWPPILPADIVHSSLGTKMPDSPMGLINDHGDYTITLVCCMGEA